MGDSASIFVLLLQWLLLTIATTTAAASGRPTPVATSLRSGYCYCFLAAAILAQMSLYLLVARVYTAGRSFLSA